MSKSELKFHFHWKVFSVFIAIALICTAVIQVFLPDFNTSNGSIGVQIISGLIFLIIIIGGLITALLIKSRVKKPLHEIRAAEKNLDDTSDSKFNAPGDEIDELTNSIKKVISEYADKVEEYSTRQNASEQALQREEFAKFHMNQEIEFMSSVYSLSNEYKKLLRKSELFQRLGKDICENFLFHVAILYDVVEGRLIISNAYFRGLNYLNDLFTKGCIGYTIPGSHEVYNVLRDQKPYTTHYPPCYEKMEESQASGHFMMIPIRGNARTWSVLAVGFLGPARFIEARDIDRMMLFSSAVGLTLDIISTVEHLEQGLHARNQELEKTNSLLQRSMHEKEEFLRGISHDLNAPLRNVAGLIDSIRRKYSDELKPELNDRLDRVRRNVEKELDLINELLELSRSKTRSITIEKINTNDLIESVLDHQNYEINEKEISVNVQSGLPALVGDKYIISQIFQNLIDNAVKYIPANADDRTIEIKCKENGQFYEFAVQDSGIGIAEGEFDKIFSVFYKAGNSINTSGNGKGIGLAMIKSLIERMNGNIWVNSRPGVGSTFFFTLPRLNNSDTIGKV